MPAKFVEEVDKPAHNPDNVDTPTLCLTAPMLQSEHEDTSTLLTDDARYIHALYLYVKVPCSK